MWHTETDIFALAIFVIMLLKTVRTAGRADRQHKALVVVLIVSIVSCVVDYVSSTAMNLNDNWLCYQISLTLYYVLMPYVTASWMLYMVFLISAEDDKSLRNG